MCGWLIMTSKSMLQVLFNLANQYAANEMFNEALNTYQVIVKNKMFTNAGRTLSFIDCVFTDLMKVAHGSEVTWF